MNFASDNAGPALPGVMDALARANAGYAASYGAEDGMAAVTRQIRDLFEAPEASVHLVATGTAANALALATLAQPWQTIFCPPQAHIANDECNAVEFYTGGAKLTLVGESDRMQPDALQAAVTGVVQGNVHEAQRGPLALTQVTERGHVYKLDELRALTAIAHAHDMPAYLDGARLANALVALGCSPAEMTWKAGIDALSLGGTKNGCLGVEAVIFFEPRKWEFELRRKRAAHLFSKHRYLTAQMAGYLADGLWLEAAGKANVAAARLAEGLRAVPECRFLAEPQANMIFATLPRATHRRLKAAEAVYGLNGALEGPEDEALPMRLVCDWSCAAAAVDRFVELAGA